jgi:hypothetical protein
MKPVRNEALKDAKQPPAAHSTTPKGSKSPEIELQACLEECTTPPDLDPALRLIPQVSGA